ncbi:MAG TPA: cardiolipin synthase [Verrucomicrobiae bacterium]|nr:cardiolipin synthase [Verrucomicrobiae bacterium]
MDWLDRLSQFWPHFAAGFDFFAALLASIHALLNKRDSRAATLWLGIIWLVPVLGPLLYLALGVNRLRRRAVSLQFDKVISQPVPENLGEPEHADAEHLKMLARVVSRVVTKPLTAGNTIQPLVNGDEAFPAMLAAIESAKNSISFCTYIFDNDSSGRKFAAALSRAKKRGVKVRVLIDAAGSRYSFPPITWRLLRKGIRFAKFLPTSLLTPWRVATINLRNHRKSLVIDGKIAFTGGMNIRKGNIVGVQREDSSVEIKKRIPRNAIQDLQFRVEGPVVAQLQEAFANDWAFATGEILDGELWFPELSESGRIIARVITDGPDEDFEKARWTLLAALAEAQTSVEILTPYFVPDTALITALNLAALRGVRVDIILPEKNNLPFVHWASRSMWWQVLERGCRIWLTPPPFDHSKLMIVDGHWVLLGSANWDARSLRLNFELNVECYGRSFAAEMENLLQKKIAAGREIKLADADARSFLGKLRDAIARLFSPYL